MTKERDLMKRIRDGDHTAWEELIRMYYGDILRYCFYNIPDKSMAQDAAQETFLKVIRYFDRYDRMENFRAFLYRIAKNTCVDSCRKSRATLSFDNLAEEPSYLENGFRTAESKFDIQTMLDCLTEELREVVLLRFSQNLTLREISKITACPLRTVQSRLRRALNQMRQQYDDSRTEKKL